MNSSSIKSLVKEFLLLGYTPWFNMATILLISSIWFIWYNWISPELVVSADTIDYYYAWHSYFDDNYGEFRTPVYPLFIGPITDLFGITTGENICIILQKLLRYVSLFYFWRICRSVGLKDKYSFWCISLWLLLPYLFHYDYDSRILTESLSISLYIFFSWNSVSFLKKPTKGNIRWLIVFTFLLIFLRPANIALLPLVVVQILYKWKSTGGNVIIYSGLAYSLLLTAIVVSYVKYTDSKYGNGPFGCVSAYNSAVFVWEAGMDNPDYIESKTFRENYREFRPTLNNTSWDFDTLTKNRLAYECFLWGNDGPYFTECKKYVRNAVKNEPEKILPGMAKRMVFQFNEPVVWSPEIISYHQRLYKWLPKVRVGWGILLLYVVIGLFSKGIHRTDKLVIGWLGIIALSQYALNTAGAQSQWGRLNIGVLFILFIAAFQLVQWFQHWIQTDKK